MVSTDYDWRLNRGLKDIAIFEALNSISPNTRSPAFALQALAQKFWEKTQIEGILNFFEAMRNCSDLDLRGVTFGASNLAAVKNFARQDQDVWFFADNDKTGIESAKRAASLLSQRSSVFTSNLEDFNDDFQAILGDTNLCRIREELHRVRGQK